MWIRRGWQSHYQLFFILLRGQLAILFSELIKPGGYSGALGELCKELTLTLGTQYDLNWSQGSNDLKPTALATELCQYPSLISDCSKKRQSKIKMLNLKFPTMKFSNYDNVQILLFYCFLGIRSLLLAGRAPPSCVSGRGT